MLSVSAFKVPKNLKILHVLLPHKVLRLTEQQSGLKFRNKYPLLLFVHSFMFRLLHQPVVWSDLIDSGLGT